MSDLRWENSLLVQAEEREAALTDSELFRLVRRSIASLSDPAVEAVVPGRQENPPNVLRLERLLPEPEFEFLFPV